MAKASVLSEEEVDRQAEAEILAEARDVMAELDIRLQQARTGDLARDTAALQIAQSTFNLRLKARSVSLTGLGPLTHRMENYMTGVTKLEDGHITDLQRFVDTIGSLLDGEEISLEDVGMVVRSMPKTFDFDVDEALIRTETDILLVMPQRSAARVVERELAACGYGVNTCMSGFEAVELIVETKPDLVITAQVMPKMSGVDLACAIAAMPTTRHIPVCLLTSLEPNHPDLAPLPMRSALIRRGASFGDDLATALQRFTIT